jgi:hypothetical protein
MKKQIAGALVASLLIGSVPGWAEEAASAKPVPGAEARQQFRDSVERAVDRAVDRAAEGEPAHAATGVVASEPKPAGPELTAVERRDLDARRAALQTDPVARGAGGIVMLVLGTALSLGLTAYLINKSKEDSSTTPTASMARH